jgi:hypothetical protein
VKSWWWLRRRFGRRIHEMRFEVKKGEKGCIEAVNQREANGWAN